MDKFIDSLMTKILLKKVSTRQKKFGQFKLLKKQLLRCGAYPNKEIQEDLSGRNRKWVKGGYTD